jgi:hypothetical protein
MNIVPEENYNIKTFKYKYDDARIQIQEIIKNYIYSENWLDGLSLNFLINISMEKNIFCYITKKNDLVISFAILKKNINSMLLLFIYTINKFRRKGFANNILMNCNNLTVNFKNIPPDNLLIKSDKFNIDIFFKKYAVKIDEENYYI